VADLFEDRGRAEQQRRLRDAGWRPYGATQSGAATGYWVSPDGKLVLREGEAVLRVEAGGGKTS